MDLYFILLQYCINYCIA